MSISTRFVLLLLAFAAALAASRWTGHTGLRRQDSALQEIVKSDVARLLAITHSRRLFRSMAVHQRDYLQSRSDGERQAIAQNIDDLSRKLSDELERYAQRMPAEDRGLVAEIRSAHVRWLADDARVRRGEAAPSAETPLQPAVWERRLGDLIVRNEQRLQARIQETHRSYLSAESQLMWVSLGAAAVALLFGGFVFAGIRRTVTEVSRLNQVLEAQVKTRTDELGARDRALHAVLDSTGEGLIEVGRDGRLTGVCSVAAVRWFGPAKAGTLLTDYLLAADPVQAAQFSLGFAQLADGVVPWELCRESMPRRLTRGALTLELDFKRVMEEGKLTKILVVLREVAGAVRADLSMRPSAELVYVLGKLVDDPVAFGSRVNECDAILRSLGTGHDERGARRELGALARAAHQLGLRTFGEASERVQSRPANAAVPLACDVADLITSWTAQLRALERFVSERGMSLAAGMPPHTALFDRLTQHPACDEILLQLEDWSRQRTVERLARLRSHAEHLAQRKGTRVHVTVEDHELRIQQGWLEKFWPTLVQVVRNAIEHGAETAEARKLRGKPADLQLTLATVLLPEGLQVELRDDGPGLDRERLIESARAHGHHVSREVQLRELVFLEGVSGAGANGRGFGLAAVRQASDAEGGSVDVVSEPGQGTTFRFRFRMPAVKIDTLASRFRRRSTLRPVAGTRSGDPRRLSRDEAR